MRSPSAGSSNAMLHPLGRTATRRVPSDQGTRARSGSSKLCFNEDRSGDSSPSSKARVKGQVCASLGESVSVKISVRADGRTLVADSTNVRVSGPAGPSLKQSDLSPSSTSPISPRAKSFSRHIRIPALAPARLNCGAIAVGTVQRAQRPTPPPSLPSLFLSKNNFLELLPAVQAPIRPRFWH